MGWTPIVDANDQATEEYVGDEPFDVMTIAFAQVIALYQARYRRPPTDHELRETVRFTWPKDQLFTMDSDDEPAKVDTGRKATLGMWAGLGIVLIVVLLVALLLR